MTWKAGAIEVMMTLFINQLLIDSSDEEIVVRITPVLLLMLMNTMKESENDDEGIDPVTTDDSMLRENSSDIPNDLMKAWRYQ